MDLYKQTAPQFYTGQGTSDATAAPLVGPGFSFEADKKVVVRASASNSASIYVGPSGVTTATGFALTAGESVEVWVDDPAKVFVVSAATQTYSWIAA